MKNTIKLTSLLVATCALSVSASAATINIVDMGPGDTPVSGFTVSSATVGDTVTLSFTQTADLDGGLGGNDTLAFDLIYEAYEGSSFSAGNVTLGSAITPIDTGINWHGGTFTTGDTLSLEVANIVYTSSESTVAFDGFTSMRAANYAATPDGDLDYYVGLTGATTISGDPSIDFDFEPIIGTSTQFYLTAGGGPTRLRQLDFQFETSAIPEPGTYALLAGLTGLTFVMLRRRRA
ncbi:MULTISPECIES: PEP-CTERM sorting domain-containing protein [unclassified Lentimonas]|uniref:PEP-CTERM sorting domain-containing protein n=1 Tax=unclassified Lentimonas TaxID=2630993 RepID=UPI00132B1184|nr:MULTISPECIES: PEP-CTERM sorting domain-containing protein [unclassified Lentimonas]CAA6689498.1 Unannotated [Lentimonas sp. CC19]CAA6692514.1 Unannotated [Lentimonas sp. CC10]CAA7069153.1 Unannotated [Lentimonas sp. CC11]